jgi:type IV pilus assembly protein PilA
MLMQAGKRYGRVIELLVVITTTLIIVIILAVALARDTSDSGYAREMAAAKAITTIHTAEVQYYSQYGRYATSLAQLGPAANSSPSPDGAELIDRDLASGEKNSFKFVLRHTPTGYALSVTPTASGTSGTHTYYSD